jgi:FAD:protein FMN transferase
MASDVQVILVDPAPGAHDYVRTRLEELEQRWSRFLPGSDVSRLNSMPRALVFVSPDTVVLLSTMQQAWRETNGGYDPAMLSAIVTAGYTKSIDGSGRTSVRPRSSAARCSIGDVTIDAWTSTVTTPSGLGLDPGGIGKGLAADMVVTELLRGGTAGALVSVGGDLAAAGTPPTVEGWHVAVEHPLAPPEALVTLAFDAGGVATSSVLSRAWDDDGHRRHHVIDPATQTCATTDLAAVTVIARAGWEAEVHATAALLAGRERVLGYFERHGLDGIAVTRDGATIISPALQCAGATEGSAA